MTDAPTAGPVVRQVISLPQAQYELYDALCKKAKTDDFYAVARHACFGSSAPPALQLTSQLHLEESPKKDNVAVHCPFPDCITHTGWHCWFFSKRSFQNRFTHLETHRTESPPKRPHAGDQHSPAKRIANQLTLEQSLVTHTVSRPTPPAAAAPPNPASYARCHRHASRGAKPVGGLAPP